MSTLTQLYYRVLAEGERPLPKAELLYLFGQTVSNQTSVLDKAVEFRGNIAVIGHSAAEIAHCGYPGADVWIPELVKRGVSLERIVPIMGSLIKKGGGGTISHTLSEAQSLVRYAKANGIRKIAVAAPRFHLLRAFMSGVHALIQNYSELKLYPVLGLPLDWNQTAFHSQGTLYGVRADFFVEEMNRIPTYQAQGNLPDIETVLLYLDRRDAV